MDTYDDRSYINLALYIVAMMEASCSLEEEAVVEEDTHELKSWQTTSKFIYDDNVDIMISDDNITQKNDTIQLQSYQYNIHD